MNIHFLPQENNYGLAEALGGLAGTGLGALGGCAARQYQLPEKIKTFEVFGANPEKAKALANSSEAIQTAWMKEAMKAQAAAQEGVGFRDMVTGGGVIENQNPAVSQPQNTNSGVNALDALGGPEQREQTPQPAQEQTQDYGNILQGKSIEDLQKYRDKVLVSGKNPKMVQDAVAILDRQIAEKMKMKSAERKEDLAERKFGAAEQREVNKETKPFYDAVKLKSKDAKENDMVVGRMEELIKEGKLTGPAYAKLMGKAGIPLDPSSAEFEKLSNGFLKNAKSVFGSRVTEGEVKLFLKTVPSLEMPDAAKLRVINNMKIMSEIAKVDNKAMRDIIKEHGGKRPHDLEDLVEERTKDIKDKLTEEFKEGIRNAEIEAETWTEWANRVLPGPIASTIGTVAKAAPGALIGAKLGSRLGPWGAAGGALLGAGGIGNILKGLGGE